MLIAWSFPDATVSCSIMASVTPSVDADPMVAPPLDPIMEEMRETKLFASFSLASVFPVPCDFMAFVTEGETHDLIFFSEEP